MNTPSSERLFTLQEVNQAHGPVIGRVFLIQTEDGPRPARIRHVRTRTDLCLLADIGTVDGIGEEKDRDDIRSHRVIDPLTSRVFISQTTPPSRQTPGT